MKRLAARYALASPYLFVLFYLIIGFLTPGYSHTKHTISRLSLGAYGYFETLNIVQFSFGLLTMIYLIRSHIRNSHTVKQISIMLGAIALTLVLVAIFPTDPIDSFPQKIMSMSWSALVHFGIIGCFVVCTPILVHRLYSAFTKDPVYKDLAFVTLACGRMTFVLCIVWFLFFYFGIINEYRGLFQKIIAIVVIYWTTRVMKRIANTWSHQQLKP